MRVSVELLLALATALVAVVLAYAELRSDVSDVKQFMTAAQAEIQKSAQKIERLEIRMSHSQSWFDEERKKKR